MAGDFRFIGNLPQCSDNIFESLINCFSFLLKPTPVRRCLLPGAEAKLFGRCAFDIDLFFSMPSADAIQAVIRQVMGNFRSLCNKGRIDVHDGVFLFESNPLPASGGAGWTRPDTVVSMGEMPSMSPRQLHPAERHDGVKKHIRIGMAQEPLGKRYLHTSQNELSSLYQAVNVETRSDPHLSAAFSRAGILRNFYLADRASRIASPTVISSLS
jgi:hypothetical protein